MPKLTRVWADGGDWEAYYDEEGSLLTQDHSVDADKILALLGYEITTYEPEEESVGGGFPDTLAEIPDLGEGW